MKNTINMNKLNVLLAAMAALSLTFDANATNVPKPTTGTNTTINNNVKNYNENYNDNYNDNFNNNLNHNKNYNNLNNQVNTKVNANSQSNSNANAKSNSNASSNNKVKIDAANSQNQTQSSSSEGGASSAVNGGNNLSISTPRQVASAYAGGAASFSQASCKPVVGGGIQTPFGGASLTATVTDENCEGVISSVQYMAMGLPTVACNRMAIATEKNAQALKMSGVVCNTVFIKVQRVEVSTPALDAYERQQRDVNFKRFVSK